MGKFIFSLLLQPFMSQTEFRTTVIRVQHFRTATVALLQVQFSFEKPKDAIII
jgi:hypothetical protein